MKKIEAIVREDRFHPIKNALEDKGFISMTVSDVVGRGKQKGITLKWRVGEHRIEFLPKKKIEMIIEDEDCDTGGRYYLRTGPHRGRGRRKGLYHAG